METKNNHYFNRNKGLLTNEEQIKLSQTCVFIAGAGGDGGLLAERLVRFGFGKIILADPEVFEENNINRQFGASVSSLGKNKALVVSEELKKINPKLIVETYTDGLNEFNVEKIISASDIIVDEIEFTLPIISVLLHRESRRQGKHVFMGANIGWGASIFCFSPNGQSFEEMFEFDEINGTINPAKYMKQQPDYISDEFLSDILDAKEPVPALSCSVGIVAGMVSAEIVLYLTGKRSPLIAPEFISLDMFNLLLQK